MIRQRSWMFVFSTSASMLVLGLVVALTLFLPSHRATAAPDGELREQMQQVSTVRGTPQQASSLLALTPTQPQQTQIQSVTQALDWLKTQQNSDGGYSGYTPGTSDAGATVDVLLAFAAAQKDQSAWPTTGDKTMLSYLETVAASAAANNAATAGKLAMGVAAAGQDPRDFGGLNLVISMTNEYNAETGVFGTGGAYAVWTQAPAILGMVAAGEPVPSKAVDYLKSLQTNGSWGDVDSTGLALQALIATGESPSSSIVANAITFLKGQQQNDGGFANPASQYDPNPVSNANTTGYATQAVLAAGQDPLHAGWTKGSATAISYLLSLQQASGQIYWKSGDAGTGTSATAQAIPALVGRVLPIRSPAVALRTGTGWIKWKYDASTGSFEGYNPGASIDAVLALASNNQYMRHSGTYATLPLDYFAAQAPSYAANGASAAGKMMMGVVVAGGNPRDVGGVNLVISTTNTYSPTTGCYGSTTWDHAWAVLGLVAIGEPVPAEAATCMKNMQATGGGWGFNAQASAATADSTGLALQALAALGVDANDAAVVSGLNYLKANQNPDSGWPGYGGDTSASSTAFALQGLAAYSQDPCSIEWTNTAPVSLTLYSPLDALMALQNVQGGFKGFSGANDPGATYQAIPGIAQQPFPPMPVNFKVTSTSGTAPFTVTFTNMSRATTPVAWTFGDGASSTATNPTHTYTSTGSYTVSLTSGTQKLVRSSYIQVYAPLNASFTANVRSGVAPLQVAFSNTSSGDFSTSLWDFGDGQTSTTISPTHTYTKAGSFQVTLTVSGTGGVDMTTQPDYITVSLPKSPRTSLKDNPRVVAVDMALQWLKTQQLEDGSYPGFSSNVGSTVDSILAVAAANNDVNAWRSSKGNSMLEYVRTYGEAYAQDTAAKACKVVVGVAAAGRDPANFDGLDVVSIMKSYYDASTGTFGKDVTGKLAAGTTWDQAWCLLGYRAIGEDAPAAAVTYLKNLANADGSWQYSSESPYSIIDSTGLALQALAAHSEPVTSTAIVSGVTYLKGRLHSNGGFAEPPSDFDQNPVSSSNGTALAIEGLIAVGEDVQSAKWTTTGLTPTTPISFLLSLQQTEGTNTGQFWWKASDIGSGAMSTQHVIPALMGRPFPYISREGVLNKGIAWMTTQQKDDGSFDGFNPGASIDACLALVAANRKPQDVATNGKTVLDYLAGEAASYAPQGASAAGKLAACVAAAGANTQSFGGIDLVAQITATYSTTTGAYGSSTWDQAWAIIGLKASGQSIPSNAVDYLKAIQATGGGWGFMPQASSADVDSTGLALQALAAAGVTQNTATLAADSAVEAGKTYLNTTQQSDGGWAGYDGTTSTSSTAFAIQGLTAVGEDATGIDWTIEDNSAFNNPMDALLGLQDPQGGFKGFSGANDPGATYQAIPGVNEKPFPLNTSVITVQAVFTANPIKGTAPLTVTFANTSSGDYTASSWAFGDGTVSQLSNPTHIYTATGVYTATLTASGTGGTSAIAQRIEVESAGGTIYLPMIMRAE